MPGSIAIDATFTQQSAAALAAYHVQSRPRTIVRHAISGSFYRLQYEFIIDFSMRLHYISRILGCLTS
jgi:hypothetical protein